MNKGYFKIAFPCMLSCLLNLAAMGQAVYRTNPDAVRLFTMLKGDWHGEGKFASGKYIVADITFTLQQDSCWIRQDHKDRNPNRYSAISLWGIDKLTGKLVVYIFDNFQGHREFTSDNWKERSIILSYQHDDINGKTGYEHFKYDLPDYNHLKITYEVSADGKLWKLGDEINFERKALTN